MVRDHTEQPPPGTDLPAATILDALGDSDCRQILAAVARDPMTIAEIVESLNIPRATAYRKIDALQTAELVAEQPRIRPHSRTVTEYVTRVGSVALSLPTDGVTLSLALDAPRTPLVTDGGTSRTDDHQRLSELFLDVTGTEEVIEQQDNSERRLVAEQADNAVVTDAADVGREDGLDDTLPDPEGSDQ